jgi:hypothetical protein
MLNRGEVWGLVARHDCLVNFFLDHFETLGWVDIEPLELNPTWTNNRARGVGVAKHLDRFLVHHALLDKLSCFSHGWTP